MNKYCGNKLFLSGNKCIYVNTVNVYLILIMWIVYGA